MKFAHGVAFAVFLFCQIAVSAASENVTAETNESVSVPFHPEVGQITYYRLRKSDVRTGEKAGSKPVILTDLSIEYLGKQEKDLVYRLRFHHIRPEDKAILDNPDAEKLLSMYQGLSFEYLGGENGYPTTVRNVEALKEKLTGPVYDHLLASGVPNAAAEQVKSFFLGLTAEAATETFLRDINPVFTYLGSEVQKKGAYKFETAVPWHLTGTELIASGSTKLLNLENDVAVINTSSSYTRDSVLHGLQSFISKAAPNLGSEKLAELIKRLKVFETYDVRQTLDANVSLEDGWPLYVREITHIDINNSTRSITRELTKLPAPD